jgi:hypothetical protein
VGRSSDLLSAEGIWEKLIVDALQRETIKSLDEKLFCDVVKKLEMKDEDSCDKSAFEKEKPRKVSFHLYV